MPSSDRSTVPRSTTSIITDSPHTMRDDGQEQYGPTGENIPGAPIDSLLPRTREHVVRILLMFILCHKLCAHSILILSLSMLRPRSEPNCLDRKSHEPPSSCSAFNRPAYGNYGPNLASAQSVIVDLSILRACLGTAARKYTEVVMSVLKLPLGLASYEVSIDWVK